MDLEKLLENVKKYNTDEQEIEMIRKAYYYAEKLHIGQKRQSGEDYIIHPLSVAIMLSEIEADTNTVVAGLLHDTLEDTDIQNILNDNNIPNDIKARTKNIYGIYKRIQQGNKLHEIHDLLALKIMVDDIKNCYVALGQVHSLYPPVNGRMKDYLVQPKTNMYKSLHTTESKDFMIK